ncbi:HPr family phosphocarrier protein [Crassaminicella indica]|uniref:HPr family phosphocarrier protein n=1 Tax=Crassaminicella indica TaxID=2855394 RepID=A0ABX8REX3_9CLOT|nr:HPr family phosphocarrier protein [Crassaminicella indica]QXM06470.1 HPr family phosphocarrier protein [Crassaminicella indica]
MINREITVMNEEGLRARRAALFVQLANKFSSDIFVEKDTKKVDGKSIMCIMALGLLKGEKIFVTVDGPDEEQAMKEIVDFFEK